MVDVRDLGEPELDALREVANIGAGHAATALSQMTDRCIMISVPEITVAPLEKLPTIFGKPDDSSAAVLMHMLGDLTGRTLLFLSEDNAQLLCDLLLRREPGATGSFDDLHRSALTEAGNILCGAYMNALSDFMKMMLLPSVPTLVVDKAASILSSESIGIGHDRDHVFCVETDFHFEEAGRELRGHFLLFPDSPSLDAILEAVKIG